MKKYSCKNEPRCINLLVKHQEENVCKDKCCHKVLYCTKCVLPIDYSCAEVKLLRSCHQYSQASVIFPSAWYLKRWVDSVINIGEDIYSVYFLLIPLLLYFAKAFKYWNTDFHKMLALKWITFVKIENIFYCTFTCTMQFVSFFKYCSNNFFISFMNVIWQVNTKNLSAIRQKMHYY